MSTNEITHASARKLLQIAADSPLLPGDRAALNTHLAACQECSEYAARLVRLEANLRRLFHTRWDGGRPDLNLQSIKPPSLAKRIWDSVFGQTQAFGKATVVAALLLGYFVIANLVGIRGSIANRETPTVIPTPNELVLNSGASPTPSIHPMTSVTIPSCMTVSYILQENDTLESIALRYETTVAAILAYNPEETSLADNIPFTGMEILIPVCESTPSHTASVPGNRFTTTPLYATISPE